MIKTHITIGIAGHAGHGKTTVAKTLRAFGQGTDEARDSSHLLSSGTEISGFWLSDNQHVALIDIPGTRSSIKNTIRGLSAVDACILVIAADDGLMPQTIEHLKIISHLKIRHGIIILSKIDLVDSELMELATLEIQEAAQDTTFFAQPIVPFSAGDMDSHKALRTSLWQCIDKISGKNTDTPFRMWTDEIKSIPGFGTVACGTIFSGTIAQNDPLYLLPPGRKTKARFIEIHGQKVASAKAGQRVGINLPKITNNDICRGMVLVKQLPDSLYVFLNAELTANETIMDSQRVKLFIGTSVSNARIVMMDRQRLESGQTGLVQFRLQKPIFIRVRDPFVICRLNTQTIIGGGMILETTKEKFRAVKSRRLLPYLKALQFGDIQKTIQLYLHIHPNHLVTRKHLAEYTGFSEQSVFEKTTEMIQAGALMDDDFYGFVLTAMYEKQTATILQSMETLLSADIAQKSVKEQEIRRTTNPRADDDLLKFLLNRLCTENRIIRRNGGYVPADYSPRLNREQQKLADKLMNYAKISELMTFTAGNICRMMDPEYDKTEAQKILDYLNDQGKLIRLNNNHFLHADAIDEIKQRVIRKINEKGSIHLTDSMDVLGYGRSKAAPVFEYLDDIGFTCRCGDRRMLADAI